ncbi:MAG TPA: NAD(P)H-hydrate epimerase, partial [Desulfobacteria bacterium]|nr:NAD(P)H-hydrate epimerase [Desulfobacteria bacterium]
MYLLTAEEMRKLDHTAINELGIPGIVLMENAGLQVVQEVFNLIGDPKGKTVTIFAGKGNNGGDGFVIARHLINSGAEVKVFLFADPGEITGDAKTNLDILVAMGHKVFPIIKPNSLNVVRLAMVYADIVIDAIFGTGFKGKVPTNIGNVIEIINTSAKPVISVDIPSGLEADTGRVAGPCIKASSTITFAQNKLGLIVGDGPGNVGKLTVADISIPEALVQSQQIKRYLVTHDIIKSWLPERKADSHKGTYGRVLVVGGSRGLSGAAAMASMGALKAGAGLITLAVPAGLHDLMEVKLTEVMTKPLPET